MSIPKIIHQTFKSSKLPLIPRLHISRLRKKNPAYTYEFYDDARIARFLKDEFDPEVFELYSRLNIGAAKADFFRYAVLYKKGGVYLDIDCSVKSRLDDFIKPDDQALLSPEKNPAFFVQWAMIYQAGHPFLKRTMEMILDNIAQNRYPHDVHKMTGPTVYSMAIRECLANDPDIPHRTLGIEYAPHLKDKYKWAKFFLYSSREDHWKKKQLSSTVLK
ncbi:glycosyltransferase [Pedobacter sp. MC2016-15]|uniref:glycosyltransferase family 32 protein n=1 Tax=Pedobacter sp. MC2016-15 TaxID=2994473 RepID=UPI002247775B|nr:glycosyltransferase [Pedobacter sp. MC2016-15]MCX2478659.1 glycosyltransferase [Pedobacter sp. MC2016-15]